MQIFVIIFVTFVKNFKFCILKFGIKYLINLNLDTFVILHILVNLINSILIIVFCKILLDSRVENSTVDLNKSKLMSSKLFFKMYS